MDPVSLALIGSAGGSLLSGLGGMIGQSGIASANQQAGQMGWLGSIMAAQAQEQGYQRAQQALSPYTTAGSNAINMLMSYLQGDNAQKAGIGGGGANLMSTFAPTMAQLEKTPGYQFSLAQGTKAAQNAAAARGLGSSGGAIQAGVDYATGLAGTTFQQQLQNYLTQNQQAYNMLYGPSQLGGQAASGIANAAMGAAGNIGNALIGAGTSLGKGITGQANALAQGTQSLFGGMGSAAGSLASIPYGQGMYNAYMTQMGQPAATNTGFNFGLTPGLFNPASTYVNPVAGLQPQAELPQPYSR